MLDLTGLPGRFLGRERHFLEAGYNVTAIDGSEELCKRARKLLGIPVRCIVNQVVSRALAMLPATQAVTQYTASGLRSSSAAT